MKAAYEVPSTRWKAILAITGAVIFPVLMAWNFSWDLRWRDIFQTWWSWVLLLPSLFFLSYGIWAAVRASKPARFELDGTRLTIFAGHGIPDFSGLVNTFQKDGGFTVDLSEAHLEWAGTALNLRTRERGTLPLGFGDSAKPLADWFAANGHTPVRAY